MESMVLWYDKTVIMVVNGKKDKKENVINGNKRKCNKSYDVLNGKFNDVFNGNNTVLNMY